MFTRLPRDYQCPRCGSDELIDNCDTSSAATKGICTNCGYNGEVNKKGARH